jgi:hypothetical protein
MSHKEVYAVVESSEHASTIALLELVWSVVLQKELKVCVEYYWRFQKQQSISLNQGQKENPAVDIYGSLSPIFMTSRVPVLLSDYRNAGIIIIYSKTGLSLQKYL